MVMERAMDDEAYLRNELYREFLNLSKRQRRNIERSENSFWSWLTKTLNRIWEGITNTWIGELGRWLWRVVFG